MNIEKICKRGVWDSTIPGIKFDNNGISNYSKMFDTLCKAYPRGKKGKLEWQKIIENIKTKGKRNKYDCIIGVSGGTDSSYLLHIAKENGLKPLAVNLDNGMNTDISVKNIKKIISKLNIDLETYVIDYEEVKMILKSYMKAGMPWIDNPTDQAIKAILYIIANREKIKYIFIGHDFRTEGKQPIEWTYSDAKQLKFICRYYSNLKLKTFPIMPIWKLFYYSFIKKIKVIKPFYYLEYNKKDATELLKKMYDWEYYGGHHHENIFTRFAIAYWLPQKFNIDKRKITLSSLILSNELKREDALKELSASPYDTNKMGRDRKYIIKKLDMTEEEFQKLWIAPNKSFKDYPSYYPLIKKFYKPLMYVSKYLFHSKPTAFFEMEERT